MGSEKLAQAADLCKFRLIVQSRIIAHAAGLIGLAADDAVINDYVRKAQADGVKAAQFLPCGGLHLRKCSFHAGAVGVLVQCLLHDAFLFAAGGQTCRCAQKAREEDDRLRQLISLRECGGEPVKLLEYAKISVHAGAELDIRAADVDPKQHGVRCACGKPRKNRCAGADRKGLRLRLVAEGMCPEGKAFCIWQQGSENAVVDVQALSVSGTLQTGRMQLKNLRERRDKRLQRLIGGIKIQIHGTRAERGKKIIEKCMNIFGEERGLLRAVRGRQLQREAAGCPVVERQPEMKRSRAGLLKIAIDVGQVDRQVCVSLLQELLLHGITPL